jgi:hypothetical protein
MKRISVATTMGPGIKVDPARLKPDLAEVTGS